MTALCKELKEHIMDSLNLTQLTLFAKASPIFHTGVEEYLHRRKLILFARFLNSIDDFNNILQSTGAVISGSSALNIVQAKEGAVEINDLDVYTTQTNFNQLVQFLEKKEKYKLIGNFSRPPAGPYNTSGISRLLRFKKGDNKIDVIVTNMSAAPSPIFQFHTTVVMNFISADTIFCAYPAWTLNMMGLIHPRMYKQNSTNLATINGLAKYVKRGFSLYSDIKELAPHASQCVKTYDCPHTTRSTNDKGVASWVFRTDKSHIVTYVDSAAIVWCLGGDQCTNEKVSGAPTFVFTT